MNAVVPCPDPCPLHPDSYTCLDTGGTRGTVEITWRLRGKLGVFEKTPRKTEDDEPAAVAFDGTFGEEMVTTNIEQL